MQQFEFAIIKNAVVYLLVNGEDINFKIIQNVLFCLFQRQMGDALTSQSQPTVRQNESIDIILYFLHLPV